MNGLISTAALAMFGGMVWLSASFSDGATSRRPCLSQQDISWYQERSRNGVSITCNETIMLQNLREQVSK